MKQTTHEIGAIGENILFNFLPNSQRIKNKPYDIVWNDVRIDVKTTTHLVGSGQARFNVPGNDVRHNGIVLVYIALIDDARYFFVDKYRVGKKTGFYLDECIKMCDLKDEILRMHKLPVEEILVDDRNHQKSIILSDSLHKEIVLLRPKWQKFLKNKHGITVNVTNAMIVGASISLLEQHLKEAQS